MPRGRLVSDSLISGAYTPPEAPAGDGRVDASSTEARIQEAIRAGHAQGLQRGRQDALAELEAERARCRASLAASLALLAALEREIVDASRARLVELAAAIAGRVLRERLASDDPLVVRIAEQVLTDAPQSGLRTIRCHPGDHHALLDAEPALGAAGTLAIVPDASIAPGGLVVEAAQELVDARLETVFAGLRAAFEEAP